MDFVWKDKGAFMLHLLIVVCVCLVGFVSHRFVVFQCAAGGNSTCTKEIFTVDFIFTADTYLWATIGTGRSGRI